MPDRTDKHTKLWQELKRRKVFKVVAMYAGTAFIILEVVNNLVNPLRLPEWTPTLVIVLLGTGFPFAVIFSWIFDLTPEGIKKTEPIETVKRKKPPVIPVKRKLKVSDIIIAVMAIVIVILLYPKIIKRDKLDDLRSSDGRISIAVMPFKNMTNDSTWNVWQDGIQNLLITSLSNSEELKVRQPESVMGLIQGQGLTNYASITPSVASTISRKLDANLLIYGSVNQGGSTVRLNAQLINSGNEEVVKSFQIERVLNEGSIFQIIDSLSAQIKNFLILSKLKNEHSYDARSVVTTNSPEAFRYFMNGTSSFRKLDYPSARNLFYKALEIDSNLVIALIYLSVSYGNQGMYDEAKKWCLKAYEKREQMTHIQRLYTNWTHANYFETPYEEIRYLKEIVEIDEQQPNAFYILGIKYEELGDYEKAIPFHEHVLQIRKKWNSKPSWIYNYTSLGVCYHKTGQLKKEAKVYKKGENDFPGNPALLSRQAILSLSVGKTKAADEYIEKYKSIRRENSWSDSDITAGVAGIYSESGIYDKAEEYYQKALSLEPQNPELIHSLAWFLIDKDRDVIKGLELSDKALEMDPDNYSYLDTKGLGLYKQGKHQEAMEILERSWELKPVYDHEIFLHLEAVKKALADNARN